MMNRLDSQRLCIFTNFAIPYCIYRHGSSSQAQMLDGTSGDSGTIPRHVSVNSNGTLFPWIVFGRPVTEYLPRDQRSQSSRNAKDRPQCSVCNRKFATPGALKVFFKVASCMIYFDIFSFHELLKCFQFGFAESLQGA